MKIKDLMQKLKCYDEELLVKFKINYGKNFSSDGYAELGSIETIDFLGDFENELVFELYDENVKDDLND